jgi:peptidyl-Asp metalloendopeptidase
MIVYTADAANEMGDTQSSIELAIDKANLAFSNSNINTQLRLVHALEVDYVEPTSSDCTLDTYLTDIQGQNDGKLDDIHNIRDEYGADIVSFWVSEGCGMGGIAYQLENPNYAFDTHAFGVVVTQCASSYGCFAHEVGHNLGARHDRFVDSTDGKPYDYNHGHIDTENQFMTMMSYQNKCIDAGVNYCTRINHFSNPEVTYNTNNNSVATGIAEGSEAANNARAINNTKAFVSGFRTAASDINLAPTITLTSSSSQTMHLGENTLLSAIANDTEDGNLDSNINWTSSIDGSLGTGTSITVTLSLGNHTITATVIDSKNEIASVLSSVLIEEEVIIQPSTLPFNISNTIAKSQWQHFGPFIITEGKLQALLSGSGDADLYIKEGSQPTNNSYDCRPYINGSAETCTLENSGSYYVSINGYANSSEYNLNITNELPVVEPEPEEPEQNASLPFSTTLSIAKSVWSHFGPFDVKDGEFKASISGSGDADLYVRRDSEPTTSTYDCRPYQNGSNEDCSLSGAGQYYVSVYGYAQMSDFTLNITHTLAPDAPIDPEDTEQNSSLPATYSGTITKENWDYYGPFTIDNASFTATLTGSGDADLYIKKGTQVTTSNYDCRPYKNGSNESCSFDSDGEYYIGVQGYAAASDYTLKLTTEENQTPTSELPANFSDTISKSSWKLYGPYTTTSGSFNAIMTGSGDGDLYVKKGSAVSSSNYDCRPYKNGSNENCTIDGAGEYFIGIYGYENATIEISFTN